MGLVTLNRLRITTARKRYIPKSRAETLAQLIQHGFSRRQMLIDHLSDDASRLGAKARCHGIIACLVWRGLLLELVLWCGWFALIGRRNIGAWRPVLRHDERVLTTDTAMETTGTDGKFERVCQIR